MKRSILCLGKVGQWNPNPSLTTLAKIYNPPPPKVCQLSISLKHFIKLRSQRLYVGVSLKMETANGGELIYGKKYWEKIEMKIFTKFPSQVIAYFIFVTDEPTT